MIQIKQVVAQMIPTAAAQMIQDVTVVQNRKNKKNPIVDAQEGVVDNKTEKTQNIKVPSLLIKILIPVLIVGAIAGVYFIKNKDGVAELPDVRAEADEETETDETIEGEFFELHVKEEIDLKELKSYGLPIMIDFGADSCVPCKQMEPVLEKLNKELHGKAIVLFVDVWKYQDLAADFPVRVIPTQVFIDSEGNAYVPSDSVKVSLTAYTSNVTNEHYFTTHEGGLTEQMIMEIFKDMGVKDD